MLKRNGQTYRSISSGPKVGNVFSMRRERFSHRRVSSSKGRQRSKAPTSSCILKLSGIGAAVTNLQPYLVKLQKPLIISTDSKSAVAA